MMRMPVKSIELASGGTPITANAIALTLNGNASLNATGNNVGTFSVVENATVASVSYYNTTDLSLGYSLNIGPGSLQARMLLRNLEDTQYQMAEGYPLPGREVRFSIRIEYGGAEGIRRE